MPISVRLLSALEQRMRDFLESRGAVPVRPVVMSFRTQFQNDVERILTQRFVMMEILSGEHQSDGHMMESCRLCIEIFQALKGKYQSAAHEFIQMNRDLLAEIELSH